MKVQILGKGCARCALLAEVVQKSADELGLDITIDKVTDLDAILDLGVTTTPALVVDGEVLVQGRVPKKSDVTAWLKPHLSSGA